MNSESIPLLLCGLALLFMSACDTTAGPESTRPAPEGIALEEVREIDGESFGGVVRRQGFAVSSEGAVAVLDPFNAAVILYRPETADTLRLGRGGEGPGEFVAPRRVLFVDSVTMAVYDRRLERISFWSTGGQHLGARSISGDVNGLGHGIGARLLAVKLVPGPGGMADGSFRVSEVPMTAEDSIRPILEMSPPREEDAQEGELPGICRSCILHQADDGGFVVRPHTLEDHVLCTDSEGRIVHRWSAGRTPEIYSEEEWVRHRRRGHEQFWGYVVDRFPGPMPDAGAEFDESRLPPPELRSVLDNTRGPLGVDGEGRLWTLPAVDRDQAGELDVFAPDGEYLGSLPLDVGPVQMSVRGEWIVVAYEDDLDEAVLRVYRIVNG
jgi:hypothetical protein